MKPENRDWLEWPDDTRAQIPPLSDRQPFCFHLGLEPEDRTWRDKLVNKIERGEIKLPDNDSPSLIEARSAVYTVCLRLYHIARVVQEFFSNPVHGNYADPFLESLLILLTWRSRIKDAHEILGTLQGVFPSPVDMLEPEAREIVHEIVTRIGFSGKRPDMVIELVYQFSERFPDGNLATMKEWDDSKVIDFLTSIPGIGHKSALCILMYSLGRDRFPIDAHIRRILRRTEALSELFQEEKELEHRQYQAEVEPLVPPSVRKQLHAGLVSLGQQFCLPRTPRCHKCPIRNVCQLYRKKRVEDAETRPYTHIELFSGAGGFGKGFGDEGNYRTILAVDSMPDAIRTYQLNHPTIPDGNILALDLEAHGVAKICDTIGRWRDRAAPEQVDVITAGIPCQGFSKAGYRTRPDVRYNALEDPRNHLYRVVVDWTRILQPRYVVIENVPEIQSAGRNEELILRSIKAAFEDLDYHADYNTVNAADFGVAQIRRRFILIASHPAVARAEIDELISYHTDRKALLDIIGHLPAIEADAGAWYMHLDGQVVTGHRARYNNDDDLRIFAAIRPGERYVDFASRCPDIIEARRESGRAVYATDSFSDKYYRLLPREPARTIVAHLQRDGNGYIHPDQIRSISPLEAALIQGFDESFVFTGSQGSQFIQIGNAIPPPLAHAIARLLTSKLQENAT
jgi:DNA (cytosine-5)-methyltransferase 1